MARKSSIVGEIMTPRPVTADPETPLRAIAALMLEHHCGIIPLTVRGRLAGVVTDRDIAMRCVARRLDPDTMTGRDLMTTRIHTIGEDEPIERAMAVMEQRQVRRLPVVRNGELVGIISQADLVANLAPQRGSELVKMISRATWRLSQALNS